MLKYFSMFSGIGGFDYALEQLNHLCVGYAEIDKYALAVYQYHFDIIGDKNYGDATKIDPAQLQDIDLLVGGFPCQAFSMAGKRGGFADVRGTLFYELARIAKSKLPKYILLENVKGLANHANGQTLSIILSHLGELGYSCQCGVLNSCYYGVPQSRERIFIVGHLIDGADRPKVFPLGQGTSQYEGESKNQRRKRARVQRQNISSTLDANYYKGPGSGRQLVETRSGKLRRLTPLECERIMGFPDNWTQFGLINGKKVAISDTQRYKMLGNAVVPDVVYEIVRRLE